MEELTYTVKALAAIKDLNIEELAKATGINENRLKNVSAGRTQLTLKDAKALSDFTGIPVSKIEG